MKQNLIHTSGILNNGELRTRVNVVDSDKILLNNTDSLSSQLINTSCEYIVIYDFDLSNGSITIPQNCTLNFQGGSISNGTIILQNTKLEGDVKWNGATISGSCSNDILTPQMFGAYPTLTETESNKTQHTLAFENLSRVINDQNTLSKIIYVSGGHYSINKKIYFTESCKFYGDGDVTIFDLYEGKGVLIFGGTSSDGYSFIQELTCTITADAHKFDRKIVVNNTTGLNVGDYLILIDTKDGSFNSSNESYKTCECIKIRDIVENNIYIDDILYGDYFVEKGENYETSFSPVPSNRTVISKFTPCTFNVSDFKILSHTNQTEAANREYYSFIIRGFSDSTLSNIIIENYGNDVAANISLGLNFKIDKCIIRSYTKYTDRGNYDAYGLSLISSQNFVVSNSTFRANSYALETGSIGTYFAIQSRNFIYDNLHFETSEKFNENQDAEYEYNDLEVHATAEYYKIINTVAPQTSCDTGGYNVTIENCKLYKINPISNNTGDYTIKSCEVFGRFDNMMLFSTSDRENESGSSSVTIENCIFHEKLRLNFRDNTFVHPYKYLTVRGNTFYKGCYMTYGYFKHMTIENNYVATDSLGSGANELMSETFSFKNNVIKDGWSFWGFTGIQTEGVISNNTIIEATEHRDRADGFLFSIRKFKGNFCQNTVISHSEYNLNSTNWGLLNIDQDCDINIFDNILQKGKGMIRGPIVKNSNRSVLTFKRNRHNSLRRTPIEDSEYGSGQTFSTADKYFSFTDSDLDHTTANCLNAGDFIFEASSNKQLYLSNKVASNTVEASISLCNSSGNANCFPGQEGTVLNPLEEGKSYSCWINNSGTFDNKLCFSKYSIDDPNFNTNELYLVLQGMLNKTYYCFTAPDPTVYLYIYCFMDIVSIHTLSIYKNHKFCEYDGAARNVVRNGTSQQRPGTFEIYQGFRYWDTDLNKEIIAAEVQGGYTYWRETDGAIAGVKRVGATSERPIGRYRLTANHAWRSNIYVGFKYYDTTIGKEIYASAIDGATVTWRETDGAIAGVKRIGATSERPSGGNIYIGFRYYDTTLGREIYASAIDSNDNNAVTWTEMLDSTEMTALSSAVSSLNTSVAALDSKISIVNVVYSELTNNTLSTSINNYYNISGSVGTLNITLNHNNESVIQRVIINLSTGSTPQITFSPGVSGETVSYFDYYSINADSNYELNIIWNGAKWIIAYNSYYNS